MARHLFDVKLGVQSPKASVTVYTDAACTQVADIQTAAGAPIAGAVVAVGLDRRLNFLGPNGVTTVYTKPSTDGSLVVALGAPDAGDLATDSDVATASSLLQGSSPTIVTNDLRSFGIYMPEAYGAVGDGVTDDTAAVQAALTNVPAGGRVYFRKAYYTPTGVSCSKQVKIEGSGALNNTGAPASGLVTDSLTAVALSLSASGTVLRDFAVVNTAATDPTAGAGIRFTGTGSGDFIHIDNVTTLNFYNNLEILDGFYYSVSNCKIYDPVNYGIYVKSSGGSRFDHGDQSIAGCVISRAFKTRAGGAAVMWESGGGLRFVDNKINGGTQPVNAGAGKFVYGLRASVADGGSTSVLVITGNSVENCTSQGIRVDQAGTTGFFSKVVIVGNEIAIGGEGIRIMAAATAHVYDVNVTGNVFTDLATGLYTTKIDGLTVGPNHHVRVTTPLNLDTSTTSYQVAKQNVVGDNCILWIDNNVGNAAHVPHSQAGWELDRDIPSTTSSVTYSALWNLQLPQNSGGVLDLTLSGFVAGVGAFVVQAKRTWVVATGAATVATVGADVTAGTAVDVSFDTATASGWILVKVRLNAGAGGTDILGRARLNISGPMFKARKGT